MYIIKKTVDNQYQIVFSKQDKIHSTWPTYGEALSMMKWIAAGEPKVAQNTKRAKLYLNSGQF